MNKTTGFKILCFVLNLSLFYSFGQLPDTATIKKEIIRGYDSAKKGNCDYTRTVASRLIPVCTQIKNDNLLAGCYRILATCYEREAINDSSLACYTRALKLYTRTRNAPMIGKMLVGLGIVHYNIGEYDKAIREYFEAIKVYEPIGDTVGMAWTYNNIGNIYFFQKAYDDALKHYLKSNALFVQKKYKDGLGVTYGNIALIYQEKKDTNNAIAYYHKALEINRDSGIEDAAANSLCNLATLYFKQKQYKKAESLYQEALEINLRIKNYYGLSLTYVGMAELAAEKKDYATAEKLLYKSLEANYTANDKQSAIMTLENLSQLYFETGRYKDAYKLLMRHKKLSDSINTGDKLAEVEARFGKEKREKEIKLLKQENEINELEIKRKQITIYASIIVGILVLITGIFFVRNYLQKKKANFLLQEKNTEILQQKTIIEHKQKEVMDSIQYAKKIQSTLIENEEVIHRRFKESFVFFQPKDIVSGDFYWTSLVRSNVSSRVDENNTSSSHGSECVELAVENNVSSSAVENSQPQTPNSELFYLAVCDSTGHGVPGAFMSLLNSSFLNEAINEKQLKEPHKILNYVRERLISSVSKDGSQDGMDAILMCFEHDMNNQVNKLTYSAANNRPLLIKNGLIHELPADKMPVGKGIINNSFSLHSIEYNQGDVLYLYTDGYADQFGGEKGKKFKYNNLNNLLKEIADKPFNVQQEILKSTFEKWKGSLEQIDDVCVIGIKL